MTNNKLQNDIVLQKAECRCLAKRALKQLFSTPNASLERESRSMLATKQLCASQIYNEGDFFFVFMSTKNEINTRYLLTKLLLDNKKVAIPKVFGDEIDFYQLDATCPLQEQVQIGAFGIAEPVASCGKICAKTLPVNSVFVVPGLAFDKNGARLGHGKGFYDRFFARIFAESSAYRLPRALIGFCYDAQIMQNVPVSDFDIAMTHLATETAFYTCTP